MMNTIRLIAIAPAMTLLLACGGGGGGGGGGGSTPLTPVSDPFAGFPSFVAAENSQTYTDYSAIAGVNGTISIISDVYGASDNFETLCGGDICAIEFIDSNSLSFEADRVRVRNLFLLSTDTPTLVDPESRVSGSVTFGGASLAGGIFTTEFIETPFEFRTFAGWLDDSVFGTTQITIGESSDREYRFMAHSTGVPVGSNPTGTGEATWEGAAVASVKTTRAFARGNATITISDLASPTVDLMFENWRTINNQAVAGISAISFEGLAVTDGSFTSSTNNEEVSGQFYGTGHTEVGGFFNTRTVTGAFGGTRQ